MDNAAVISFRSSGGLFLLMETYIIYLQVAWCAAKAVKYLFVAYCQ